MAIFAIGDLHLSFASNKPMDVFGEQWKNHFEQIETNWRAVVQPEDLVLLPGDISWAMQVDEVKPDLDYIGRLPGTKIMIRGNHDYWWSTIKKVRSHLPEGVYAIQNDSLVFDGYAIAGTRGWTMPSSRGFTDEDHKIYVRELGRLQLSLEHAKQTGLPIICMLHYPPTDETFNRTEWIDLLESYDVKYCVYGHLHGDSTNHAMPIHLYSTPCELVSADAISFRPIRIL